MNNNELNRSELSALLDGEIKDLARVEELGEQLKADSALAAEFEEQREIKALLASLPEHEAPDFLATRVLGEIADARSKRRPAALLRNLGLVATGFVLCLALVLTVNQFRQTDTPAVQDPARDLILSSQPAWDADGMTWAVTDVSPNGVPMPMYAPEWDWNSVPRVEGVQDERIQDFVEFAKRAHKYRVFVTSSEAASPDMTDAVLVLDQGSVK
jgi:hypothetical protein